MTAVSTQHIDVPANEHHSAIVASQSSADVKFQSAHRTGHNVYSVISYLLMSKMSEVGSSFAKAVFATVES